MISALKRLTKRQDDSKGSPFPSGIAAIGQAMQKKFAKGVNYNMKIVIKGDRNTGKSCLLQRLQGKPFNTAYIPTQEIQAASINWNYRGGEDIVKVDVWDIVDKGQKKKQQALKISNNPTQEKVMPDNLALDADAIDVYKGTHGVIMLLDITKLWTWSYIERELPRIPYHLPVLVLANFRDMGEHRLVDIDRMTAFIQHLDRSVGSAEVNFAEASLKDGFGLHYLYKFLNIPFLILQRETLLRQLEANALEIENIREDLLCNMDTVDQNYSMFLDSVQNRKPKTSESVSPSSEVEETASEPSPSTARAQQIPVASPEIPVSQLPPANARQSSVTSSNKTAQERNYTARVENHPAQNVSDPTMSSGQIDDFTPEDQLDPSFLGEGKQKRWWNKRSKEKQPQQEPDSNINNDSEEDSDVDVGNPLVADYQDLSSDDEQQTAMAYKTSTENKVDIVEESSDDEEDDDRHPNPLVADSHDLDSAGEETPADIQPTTTTPLEVKTEKPTAMATSTQEDNQQETVDKRPSIETTSDLNDESSADENETDSKYEVVADFDLDEPELENWLGGSDDVEASQNKKKPSKEKAGETTEKSSDTTKPRNSSFTFAADELDIFVSEQLRKTSLTQVEETTDIKKPKKKKERKKEGEGGDVKEKKKKKKKKITKEKDSEDADEKEQTKKKPKTKLNKKTSAAKITTETEDYELL